MNQLQVIALTVVLHHTPAFMDIMINIDDRSLNAQLFIPLFQTRSLYRSRIRYCAHVGQTPPSGCYVDASVLSVIRMVHLQVTTLTVVLIAA